MIDQFIKYLMRYQRVIFEHIRQITKYQWTVFGSFITILFICLLGFYLTYNQTDTQSGHVNHQSIGLMIIFFLSLGLSIGFYFIVGMLLEQKSSKLSRVKNLLDSASTKKEIYLAQIVRFCMHEIEKHNPYHPFDCSDDGLKNRKYDQLLQKINAHEEKDHLKIVQEVSAILKEKDQSNQLSFQEKLKVLVDGFLAKIEDKNLKRGSYFYIPKGYLLECFSHGKWLLVSAFIFLICITPILIAGLSSFGFFDTSSCCENNKFESSWWMWWPYILLDTVDVLQKILVDLFGESFVDTMQGQATLPVHILSFILVAVIVERLWEALKNVFSLKDETKSLIDELKYETNSLFVQEEMNKQQYEEQLYQHQNRLNLLLTIFPEQMNSFQKEIDLTFLKNGQQDKDTLDHIQQNALFLSHLVAAFYTKDGFILNERFKAIQDQLKSILSHTYFRLQAGVNEEQRQINYILLNKILNIFLLQKQQLTSEDKDQEKFLQDLIDQLINVFKQNYKK